MTPKSSLNLLWDLLGVTWERRGGKSSPQASQMIPKRSQSEPKATQKYKNELNIQKNGGRSLCLVSSHSRGKNVSIRSVLSAQYQHKWRAFQDGLVQDGLFKAVSPRQFVQNELSKTVCPRRFCPRRFCASVVQHGLQDGVA